MTDPDAIPPGRRPARLGRHRGTAGLIAVGALMVAVHLGLGTAAVTSPAWTSWVLTAILVLVAVKLLASIALGRRLLRHRRRP